MSPGDWDFDYDNIGNREDYTLDSTTKYYCTNGLNQYEHTDEYASCPSLNEDFSYDADGDWRDDAGPYAEANPFRFSTKWLDDELAGSGIRSWRRSTGWSITA